MAKEIIRVTGIGKLYPVESSDNVFIIRNSLNAEEIFAIVKKLKESEAKSLTDISTQHFSETYSYNSGESFVVKNLDLLTTKQECAFLSSEGGNKAFQRFLAQKNLDPLQSIYGDFLENSDKKRVNWYDTKEKLIKLLISDPAKLLLPIKNLLVSIIMNPKLDIPMILSQSIANNGTVPKIVCNGDQ